MYLRRYLRQLECDVAWAFRLGGDTSLRLVRRLLGGFVLVGARRGAYAQMLIPPFTNNILRRALKDHLAGRRSRKQRFLANLNF